MQKSEGPGDGEIVSESLIHMAEAPAGKYSRRWCPCPQKNCPTLQHSPCGTCLCQDARRAGALRGAG